MHAQKKCGVARQCISRRFEAKTVHLDSPVDLLYMNSPIGHNTLSSMMIKDIIKAGNLDATGKSNHSLRSIVITQMCENNAPEKLMMERSDHLSVNGIHSYECTSVAQ